MFFNKHMNIVTNNGGEKIEKIFFIRNTRISQAKNDGKKSSGKIAKTRFFYKHTNIMTKKWGEKREKKLFQKHTYIAGYKRWKKSIGKSAKIRFFINT